MMKILKNKASELTTFAEGADCVPIACFKKLRTITILVKEVIIIIKEGTRLSIVMSNKIFTALEKLLPSRLRLMPTELSVTSA